MPKQKNGLEHHCTYIIYGFSATYHREIQATRIPKKIQCMVRQKTSIKWLPTIPAHSWKCVLYHVNSLTHMCLLWKFITDFISLMQYRQQKDQMIFVLFVSSTFYKKGVRMCKTSLPELLWKANRNKYQALHSKFDV